MARKITATVDSENRIIVDQFRIDPANFTLGSQSNVNISSPVDRSLLVYDNSSQNWIDSQITLPSGTGTIALTTDIPSTTGFITASSTDILTNKTIDAGQLTGTIDDARIPSGIARDSELSSFITATSVDTLTNKTITTGGDLTISKTGAVAHDIKFLDGESEQARFSLQDHDTGNNLTLTTYGTNDLRLQATSGNVVIMNGGSSYYTFASSGATFTQSLNLTDGLQSSKFVEITNHGSDITRDASEMDAIKGKIVYFGGSATKTLTFPHYSGFSTPHDEWIIGNTGTGVITCNATSDTVFKIFQPGTGYPATGLSTFDIPVGAKAHIQGIGYKLIFVELTDGIITGKELNINGTASITGDFLEISSSTAPTADDACHPVISLYDSSDRSIATLGSTTNLTDGREHAGAIRWYFNNTAGEKSFCAGIRGRVTDSVDGAERGSIEFTLPNGQDQENAITDVTASHTDLESPVMTLHKYGLVMRSGNDLQLGAPDDVLKWDTGSHKQELRGRSSETSGADSLIELPDASGTVALEPITVVNSTAQTASNFYGQRMIHTGGAVDYTFAETGTISGTAIGKSVVIVNAGTDTITCNFTTSKFYKMVSGNNADVSGSGVSSFTILKGGIVEVVIIETNKAIVFGSGL